MIVNSLSFVLEFILSALAVYYAAWMLAEGRGFFDIFTRWRLWLYNRVQLPYQNKGNKGLHWFYDGAICRHCLPFWLSIVPSIYLGFVYQLNLVDLLAVWFALGGTAVVLVMQERNT